MKYQREFVLQACHFNGAFAYECYRAALSAATVGDCKRAYDHLRNCLPSIHGHNFLVKILTIGSPENMNSGPEKWGQASFLIDDEELETLVMEWNNTNLSVHKDFENTRATTENMARLLVKKLNKKWPRLLFEVEVWETETIMASYNTNAQEE